MTSRLPRGTLGRRTRSSPFRSTSRAASPSALITRRQTQPLARPWTTRPKAAPSSSRRARPRRQSRSPSTARRCSSSARPSSSRWGTRAALPSQMAPASARSSTTTRRLRLSHLGPLRLGPLRLGLLRRGLLRLRRHRRSCDASCPTSRGKRLHTLAACSLQSGVRWAGSLRATHRR